jgi:hypothetical protein
VLARAGMTTEEWTDAQRVWLDRMGMDLERGRFELTNRYTHAVLERQRALSAASPPAAAAAPLPPAKTPPASPIEAPPPPDFAKAPPPPAASPPIASPPMVAMPVGAHLSAAAEMADDPAPTLSLPFVAVVREVLPFTKGPSNFAEPNATETPENLEAGATLPLDEERFVLRDALPFKSAPPAVRSLLRSEPDAIALDRDGSPPRTEPSAAVKVGSALPFVAPTDGGAMLRGPIQPPAERMKHVESLTLGQYATICAAVRASPEHVAEIRSHYGMDAPAWVALHTLWRERFQRDPTLRARWQALIEAASAHRAG